MCKNDIVGVRATQSPVRGESVTVDEVCQISEECHPVGYRLTKDGMLSRLECTTTKQFVYLYVMGKMVGYINYLPITYDIVEYMADLGCYYHDGMIAGIESEYNIKKANNLYIMSYAILPRYYSERTLGYLCGKFNWAVFDLMGQHVYFDHVLAVANTAEDRSFMESLHLKKISVLATLHDLYDAAYKD